ncbi:MAG: V-type ATPase subunit [Clostridia bacterium]|nr:V-type ATPase subunit [Clostridia bacterium]
MPQNSVTYGVTRIRCHEKDLINRDRMERMAEGTLEEAMRTLQDMGYGSMPDATPQQAERMIERELTAASELVREVSFDPTQTDLFLMKADVHNLKLLLKLRLTDSGEQPAYMAGGCFSTDALYKMVQNGEYRDLPDEFRKALAELEQSFQNQVDPALISMELDKAYIAYAYRVGKGVAKTYFKGMADFSNLLALLRIRAMGGGLDKLKDAMLPGGDIPESRLIQGLEAPADGLAKLLATGPARERILKGLESFQKNGSLSSLERERDNYLLSLVQGGKFEGYTILPVIAYLLAREQEAKCLRLILTAKRNRLPDSVITERLRELYG